MTSLLRISLLALFLAFGLLNASQAQEKYEYAIVAYHPPIAGMNNRGLFVSISGKPFEEIAVKKNQTENVHADFTIVLNYVQGMADEGWRVINTFTNSAIYSTTFVLERKTTN